MTPRRKRVFDRRRMVTDEPMGIDPGLMGTPLATPWRRAAAIVIDLGIVFLLIIVQIVSINLIRSPALVDGYIDYVGESDPEARSEKGRELLSEVIRIAHRRNTGVFPEGFGEAIETGNDSILLAALSESDFSVVISLDSDKESEYDPETGLVYIRNDVMSGFGHWAAGAPAFLIYFTILTWLLRGRTVGKAVFGIRVAKLSGERLSLWDSFGRAGGYAASAATFLVGFLEAFWHPNRQTVHDRISGTVVVRTGKKGERETAR